MRCPMPLDLFFFIGCLVYKVIFLAVRMLLAAVHQITENLHKRILDLETRMRLGPAFETRMRLGALVSAEEFEMIRKVHALLKLICNLFHYDKYRNVDGMFQKDPYASELMSDSDFIYFENNPRAFEEILKVYSEHLTLLYYADDRVYDLQEKVYLPRQYLIHSMIAYIVLQIALTRSRSSSLSQDHPFILTEYEIAHCIAKNATDLYVCGSMRYKNAIKRFLGIIKDAINGEVYDQLFDYKYYRRDGQNHLPIATDHQREIHIFLQDEMKPFKTQK